jgi:hypothetical protein
MAATMSCLWTAQHRHKQHGQMSLLLLEIISVETERERPMITKQRNRDHSHCLHIKDFTLQPSSPYKVDVTVCCSRLRTRFDGATNRATGFWSSPLLHRLIWRASRSIRQTHTYNRDRIAVHAAAAIRPQATVHDRASVRTRTRLHTWRVPRLFTPTAAASFRKTREKYETPASGYDSAAERTEPKRFDCHRFCQRQKHVIYGQGRFHWPLAVSGGHHNTRTGLIMSVCINMQGVF